MMTTPVNFRFFTRVLLMLAALNLTHGRPHHDENQPTMMQFCGNDLALVIDEVCSIHKSPAIIDPLILDQPSSNDESIDNQRMELDDKKSDALLRQCCVIGCTEAHLATFCRIDRNQIRQVAARLRNEDVDVNWLFEFLPRNGTIHPPE